MNLFSPHRAAPADLARSLERNRARFRSRIMVDPSAWQIAKALAPVINNEGGEGLRGIFDPAQGAHGGLFWWIARHASHHEGQLMLGYSPASEILQVEMNVDNDGTIYASWPGREKALHPKFLAHPLLQNMVNGCLTYNGKQLQIRDHRVKLLRSPATSADLAPSITDIRRPLWLALVAEADEWAKLRRSVLPDGRPRPIKDALVPYRVYLREQTSYGWFRSPVPDCEILPDRTIQLAWRRTGSVFTLRFADRSAHARQNLDGKVRVFDPIRLQPRRRNEIWLISSTILHFQSREERENI